MDFLLLISLRSLALATGAMLVLAWVKSPAIRHAAWTLVAAGMLAIAIAPATLPTVPVRVLRPIPPAPPVPVTAIIVPSQPVPPPPRPFPWTLVYAAGVAVSAGRLVYGCWLTRRLLRAATRIQRFDDPIYESGQITVPLTIAGRILLPAGWASWDAAKLDAVLVHERTHVRRSDWTISILAAVNRCVYWFHPLAWWLEAHVRSLAEEACDDASLAHVARESYAQALIDMAAAVRGTKHRVAWEALAMAKGAEVRMRIERILDDTRPLSIPITRSRWLAIAIAAVPLIFFAAVARPAHVRAQQPQPTPLPAVAQVPQDEAALKQAQIDIERLEHEIAEFKRENMGKLPEQFQTNVSQLSDYQMALSNVNEAVGRLQQQRMQLETHLTNLNSQLAYYQSQTATGSANVAQRIRLILETQSQIAALREMYTETAPQIKTARARLAALERERDLDATGELGGRKMILDTEGSIALVKTQIQGTNMEMDQQLTKARQISEVIAQYQQRIDASPKLEEQYAKMMRAYQDAYERVERLRSAPAGPNLISRYEAEYTAEARQAGLQGKVELSVTVGTDGIPRDIQVIHGLGSGLDDKATEAVKQWRFRPATLQGNPVPAIILVEVPFRLQ
jgi:TonB family protein